MTVEHIYTNVYYVEVGRTETTSYTKCTKSTN